MVAAVPAASPDNRWDDYPDWSPSGKSIVFTRYPRGELTAPELWIYRRGRSRYLTQGEEPAWSVRGEIVFERSTVFQPDGSPVEGPRDENGDPEDIYVIRPDGSGLRRITSGYEPEWSPHGSTIIFSTNACGYGCLHTVRRDGRERRRIGRGIAGFEPDYSPDGRRVVYAGGAHSQIVVMRRNGTRRRVVFEAEGDFIASTPDWQSVLRRRSKSRRPTSCGAGARIAC